MPFKNFNWELKGLWQSVNSLGQWTTKQKNDVGENMTRVHKSTNSKDAQMASASLNMTNGYFNVNLALTNNFPRLTVKNIFLMDFKEANQNFS